MEHSFATTDLCDAHEEKLLDGSLSIVTPEFKHFGKRRKFAGPVTTLKVFEDNSLVRGALEKSGEGRVLVIDGGASQRCALLGGNLAVLAEKNIWAGVIVNGCVRDVDEINVCLIGVRALGPHPRKSVKKGAGEVDVPVSFGGITFRTGDWCYADADGIIVARSKL